MRKTFSIWRSVSTSPMKTVHSRPSRAAAVAVATPCWPAPVSAMTRRLAHPLGQQGLADDVVDLVRSGVRQVLALREDPQAEMLPETSQRRDGRGPTGELAQDRVVLVDEDVVAPRVGEGRFEFQARGHERLGNESSSEVPESSSLVRTDMKSRDSLIASPDHERRRVRSSTNRVSRSTVLDARVTTRRRWRCRPPGVVAAMTLATFDSSKPPAAMTGTSNERS